MSTPPTTNPSNPPIFPTTASPTTGPFGAPTQPTDTASSPFGAFGAFGGDSAAAPDAAADLAADFGNFSFGGDANPFGGDSNPFASGDASSWTPASTTTDFAAAAGGFGGFGVVELEEEERRVRLVEALRACDVFGVHKLLRPGQAAEDWQLVPEQEWMKFVRVFASPIAEALPRSMVPPALAVALARAVRDCETRLALVLIAGGAAAFEDKLFSLHWAVKTNQIEAVRALLKNGRTSLDAMDEGERTPVFYAVQLGLVDMVRLLVAGEEGIAHNPTKVARSVHIPDPSGRTCILVAAAAGRADIMHLLLANGGAPRIAENTESALHVAAEHGYDNVVAELLAWYQAHSESVELMNSEQHTPLSLATANGHSGIVAQLLDAGASPNASKPPATASLRDRGKHVASRLPLMEALQAGHYDIMAQLVAGGADVSAIVPKQNRSLLELVMESGNEEALAALTNNGKSSQVLFAMDLVKAIKHGSESDVAAVIAQGVDPNLMVSGERPLQTAIKARKLSAVKQLLAAGADPKRGESSVVALAVMYRFAEAIPLLIEHGADVTALDAENQSALYVSATTGNTDAVAVLLKAGAEAVTQGRSKQPLVGALTYGQIAAAELLLQHIDNPDTVVEDNSTPLMYAVELGDKDSIAMLLAHGADASYELPGTSSSALSVAIERAQLDVLQMLIDAGTDLSRGVGMQQVTPLLLACKRGSTDVMELLLKAGADPAQPDASGDGVWAYATRSSLALPVIQKLHQHGLVFPLRSPHGVTIVSEMARRSSVRVVEALFLASGLAAPVEPPAGEVTESSPILSAAVASRNASTALVEVLVLFGERFAPFDPRAGAALAKAAASCKEDLCAAILSAGASVDYQDRHGRTALMFGAEYPAIVGTLLLHEANVFLTDAHGRRAVEMARDRHSVALLRYFEQKRNMLQLLVGARVGAPNDGEFVANSLSRWASHSSFDVNVLGMIANFISGKRPAFLRIRE